MPTSQSQLISILKDQINDLEEKCPGYRGKAAETLSRIIALEYQNTIRPITMGIRLEVKRHSLELGSFLADHLKDQPDAPGNSVEVPE